MKHIIYVSICGEDYRAIINSPHGHCCFLNKINGKWVWDQCRYDHIYNAHSFRELKGVLKQLFPTMKKKDECDGFHSRWEA